MFWLQPGVNKEKLNEQKICNLEKCHEKRAQRKRQGAHCLMWSVDFPTAPPPVPLAEQDALDIILLLIRVHPFEGGCCVSELL